MRVLYVSQATRMSGAERSLVDLIDWLPNEVEPVVATPAGELAEVLRDSGVPIERISGTDVSFRPHPIHTPRGLIWMAATGGRIRRLARSVGADVVHANTTRAGLAAGLAAVRSQTPLLTHVRDWVPPGRAGRVTLGAVARRADIVVANSRDVASQIPASKNGRAPRVVHNGVDIARFDPQRLDREEMRGRLDLAPDALVMVTVAQFSPWKAQDDAVRILAALKPTCPKLRLLVVGTAKFTAASTRYDNAGFERDVHELAGLLDVKKEVLFLGERSDIPEILRAADLLLVPSWREAFGRIVIEGMAMHLPVLATQRGGPAEIVRDGVDGFLLEPRTPALWARRAGELLADSEHLRQMGAAGRRRVEAGFTAGHHAAEIIEVYRELVER